MAENMNAANRRARITDELLEHEYWKAKNFWWLLIISSIVSGAIGAFFG